MPDLIWVVLVVLLTTALDLWLLRRIGRALPSQDADKARLGRAVYLFGRYSPILTWLRDLFSNADESQSTRDLNSNLKTETMVRHDLKSSAGGAFLWKSAWLDWLIIGLAVLFFCSGILDLKADTRLPGNEAEVFQTLDWTLVNSLRLYRQFPLWNPYLYTGLPYIADPMLHVYNPVVTVPVLLLGVRAGFKLGVFLSFLIAALGMWRLGSTLGMGRPGRIWIALLYAFAGQPVGRFFQGQYLFVLGFAWIPWIVSSLFLLTETRRRRHIVETALFMALLFFSGNAYYPFYMLLTAGLFAGVMLVLPRPRWRLPTIDFRLLKIYAITAALALGMIAIQLLPLVEFWPRMSKDLNIEGSHTLGQIFLDYTSKDPQRPDAYRLLPAREEFYAYIGLVPFLSLCLLPLAFWRRNPRPLLFFLMLLLLVVGWVSLEHVPWGQLLLRIGVFHQFRHLLRILIFGSFAVIVLAGLGLDTLWTLFNELRSAPTKVKQHDLRRALGYAGLSLLGVFMLIGLVDVFRTNRPYLHTVQIEQAAYQVMGWLRRNDLTDYYVRHNPNNGWHDAVIASGLRFTDVWYHFADIRDLAHAESTRPVQVQPNYIVQSAQDSLPDAPGVIQKAEIAGYRIYYLPESLPMAFTVANDRLQQSAGPGLLLRSEVTPLIPFFLGPNDIEVIANSANDQTLMLLITHYPGWRVDADGQEQYLRNVGGYLAVDALPGVHKYMFSFRPFSFFLGLFISLTATGVALYLFLSDADWQAARQYLLGILTGWLRLKDWIKHRLPETTPTLEAVYRQGALYLDHPLDLPEESRIYLSWGAGTTDLPRLALRRWVGATVGLLRSLTLPAVLPSVLFLLSLGVYLGTRLVRLEDWPIYFFTDEAVHTMLAADLVRDGFQNYAGDFLPAFFENGGKYRLGFSVYLHVLPYLFFGKSVFVTRATSVLVTLACAVAVGLILRHAFGCSYWWSGVLFLSIVPAWFLHSRTAFEYATAVTLYALFLYFYLLYRIHDPYHLYKALVAGALAFYTYSPMQMVVLVSGVLLALADFRYHWTHRRIALGGLGLLLLLALPYVRFVIAHPRANYESLSALGSYWLMPQPLSQKLAQYFEEYLSGLNPFYWFLPNQHDLMRHLMKGYGHLLLGTLPLMAVGLWLAVRNFRSAAHRTVLLALLAAPAGAALVELGITRVLVMVVPLTLLIALGTDYLFGLLERRRVSPALLAGGLFIVLSAYNVSMLRDALVHGPTWYQDYTLGGMQYGARQLYRAVLDYTAEHPETQVLVSPNWANGADVVARFFSPDPMPFQLGNIDPYLNQRLRLTENTLFVMTPEEFEHASSSGKFQDIQVEQTLHYPNGKPGFYFVRLRYVDNIDQILEQERERRRVLVEQQILIGGEAVSARYSMTDMGTVANLFDDNPDTVMRTLEANPMVVELSFPQPQALRGLSVIIGSARMEVTVRLYATPDSSPQEFVQTFLGSVSQPEWEIDFDQTLHAQLVHLEFKDLGQGEPAHVHVWEIRFR